MSVKVWWLGSRNGQGNFGDILTPFILKYFNIEYEYVQNYREAELLCVGSIARRAATNTKVLGSGIIKRYEKVNSNANWKFVRGPYTRQRIIECGGECPDFYGDPGLLLPLIVEPSKNKHYKIGYVPHSVDYKYVKENFSKSFVVSLGTRNFKTTVEQITNCDKIISSSLHGIICAHAYGIPAAWVYPHKKLKGDDIKFKDYFESVGIYNYKQSTYEDPIFINPGKINLAPIIKIFEEVGNKND